MEAINKELQNYSQQMQTERETILKLEQKIQEQTKLINRLRIKGNGRETPHGAAWNCQTLSLKVALFTRLCMVVQLMLNQ